MKSVVLIDADSRESESIKKLVLDIAARLTDEHWSVSFCRNNKEVSDFLKDEPLIDFCCVDVSVTGVLKVIPGIRKQNSNIGILLIADESVSPIEYLKPGIKPDSLVIRPIRKQVLSETLEEFIKSYIDANSNGEDEAFVIETKEGKTFLPYSSIYYFEAREKKIFARTLYEEYGFYSSMEELADVLPEIFLRCHRSYIVNVKKIKKMISAENTLELDRNQFVPISRTYKSKIKEL